MKKNILLGITGSIAAYKIIDLAKELSKNHNVKVIITPNALNFINLNLFKYFNIDVYLDEFKESGIKHIELARWADTMAIVPCSANTIAKIVNNIADNLLTTTIMALKNDVCKIIVPAMNSEMYSKCKDKINILEKQNWNIIDPDAALLACGEEGEGKMPKIELLKDIIPSYSVVNNKKTILITAGATIEPIDSFRYITNAAKGGTSYLLALKLLAKGYKIILIKGINCIDKINYLSKNKNVKIIEVVTANDVLNKVMNEIENVDWYISPMAIGDFSINNQFNGKIKKKKIQNLEIKENPDILQSVINLKKTNLKIIGFAAESSLNDDVIKEKLQRKPVDLLVANQADNGLISGRKIGFNTSYGNYWFIKDKNLKEIDKLLNLNKTDVVEYIFNFIIKKELSC